MKHLCSLFLVFYLCSLFGMNGMAEQALPVNQLAEVSSVACKKHDVGVKRELQASLTLAQKLDILRTAHPLLFARLCVYLRLIDRSCVPESLQQQLGQYALDPSDPDLDVVMDRHLVGEGLDMRYELKIALTDQPDSVLENESSAVEGSCMISEGA